MSAVTDQDMGFDRIMRELSTLEDGAGVYVGVRQQAGAKPAGRRAKGGAVEDDPDVTIVEIATRNEFGVGVPERSFLRDTADANEVRYTKILADQLGAVVDGKQTPEGGMKFLGAAAVRDVQVRIRSGIQPPNAPETVAAKGSSTPLIDTGRLRQSIDYQVVMGDGEPT